MQFLIRALTLGGAERQLVLIASGLAARGHDVSVVTFYPGLPALHEQLLVGGVGILQLEKRGRWDILALAASLRRVLQSHAPDVVYSFLPTANVLSSLLVRGRAAVVWGVRASAANLPGYDWLGRALARTERALRAMPDMVICNSIAGYELCRALGFQPDKLGVARNIIDLKANRFDADLRTTFRASLGIYPETIVVGAASRIDPMKGLETLLAALPVAREVIGSITLLVAGDGKPAFLDGLRHRADSLGLSGSICWLGRVDNMQAFYSAVDVFCSPSCGEGMSNVVAEAMACGRICVATRVGDSAQLIGDDSLMAEPDDADSLGAAIVIAAGRLPGWNGDGARSRVATLLSAETAIAETELLLQKAVNRHRKTIDARHGPEG